MGNQLVEVQKQVYSLAKAFDDVAKGEISFKREALFAIQALEKNDYLMGIARNNPRSLQNAVMNIASIGLSLNSATSHAYLVPRKGVVCLDVSYRGLVELAVSSTAMEYVQAKLVYKKDTFKYLGIKKEPSHEYSPFEDRGALIGVYCVGKTSTGDYLTETMSLKECHEIRDKSEAWKKRQMGPWKDFEGEMMKKTVVKRASKLWPMTNNRLANAIEIVNEYEGINFQEQDKEAIEERKKVTAKQQEEAKKQREDKKEYLRKIELITNERTKDMELQEKGEFFARDLQVDSWKELEKKSNDYLLAVLNNLNKKAKK